MIVFRVLVLPERLGLIISMYRLVHSFLLLQFQGLQCPFLVCGGTMHAHSALNHIAKPLLLKILNK